MVAARNGFTLIELLVVLAIMALVLMIVAPKVGFVLPQMEVRSGAREVAAALREARSRAIVLNKEVTFGLDLNHRSYSISGDRRAHELPRNVNLSLYTAQSERVGQTSALIRFFPDGSSTGGHVRLSIGKKSYTVTIDWLTGRVQIHGSG